jgi:copper transport protein
MTTRRQVGPVPGWGRVLCRIVAGAVLVLGFGAMAAAPAQAHAVLVSSDPAADALLVTAPSRVTLTFDDTVVSDGSAIRVLDDARHRVDDGTVFSPANGVLAVALKGGLANGTYTVLWTVTSDDTHPVSGTFSFAVGSRTSTVQDLGPERNDPVGVALGLLRWCGYLGLALGPGLLLVSLLLWPEGLRDRGARRVAFTGLGLLAASTIGGMLLQGVWASGAPLSALWQAPETLDTHSRKFDLVYAWRAFLLVGFAVAMALAFLSRSMPSLSRRVLLGAVSVSSVALLVTWPVVGHSAVGPALALLANLAHSLAMVLWIGGLLFVAVTLSRADRTAELADVLPRFSRLALGCAVVLVVTGVFMTWREVGAASGLVSTEFGRVLLAKLAAVALLFLLGRSSQRWVARNLLHADAEAPLDEGASGAGRSATRSLTTARPAVGVVAATEVALLRRGVTAEIVVAALVLAITSALVVVGPGI